MAEIESETLTPEIYNAFLQRLELKRVRLVSAKIEARVDHPKPADTEIRAEYKCSFKNRDKGFEAFATYTIEFVEVGADTRQGSIEATFGLQFESREPMRENIFKIFGELNLKVNSWPYAREYVQTNMGRMDWPSFTLPLLKSTPPVPSKQKRDRSKPKAGAA